MTQEMKELIDRELASALESGDARLIDRAVDKARFNLPDAT